MVSSVGSKILRTGAEHMADLMWSKARAWAGDHEKFEDGAASVVRGLVILA
jgi:hypothetical protein